jgi:methionyl-tRNA formyltransferase
MRVGFAGTPAFAVSALEAIVAHGYPVALVLTQPDRPSGRGLKLEPPPVKTLATSRGLCVLQPATLKGAATLAQLRDVTLDVLVVAAYGLLLPRPVLEWPRHGCLNIHASLLPRWRGAAPIQRALLAGDAETGVTIMQMDAGLDTGPILDVERVAIAPRETGGSLHDKLAAAGARTIVAVLERLARDGALVAQPQPTDGITHAAKITVGDTAIDWRASARAIDRQVRAFDPAPGASAQLGDETVKIRAAAPLTSGARSGEPGEILRADAAGLVVACGDEALRVTELQPAGGRRMSAAAFVAGRRLAPGARFVSHAG